MPYPQPFTWLDVVDILLMLAGGGVLLVGAVRWTIAWPRSPLRGAPLRLNVLTAAWVWLAILAWGTSILVASGLASFYDVPGGKPESLALQRSILAANLMPVFVSLACLWIAGRTFVAGWRGWGLGRRPLAADLWDGIRGFLAATCLCTLVAWATELLLRWIAPSFAFPVHAVFEALEDPATPLTIDVVAIGGALLLAPVGEELFFRGILQTGLQRLAPPRPGSFRHRWTAIAAASLLFGAMHLPVVQNVPALVVLGIILGYQYERTGSLLVPIFVHMFFNAKSLLWHALAA